MSQFDAYGRPVAFDPYATPPQNVTPPQYAAAPQYVAAPQYGVRVLAPPAPPPPYGVPMADPYGAPPPVPFGYAPAYQPSLPPLGRDVLVRRTIVGFAAFPVMLLLASILTIPLFVYLAMQGGFMDLADGGVAMAEELMSPRYLGLNAGITIGSQLLIILLALLFTGELRNWRNALALRPPVQKRWYLIGALLGLAAFALLQGISALMYQAGGSVESSDTSDAIINTTGMTRYVMLILLVPFVIPLVEEMFFRGLLFNSLANGNMLRRLPPRTVAVIAALVSSLFFASAHLQMTGGIGTAAFIMGYTGLIALLCCWLTYRTGSILPGWILHLVYNGVTVIAMLATGM